MEHSEASKLVGICGLYCGNCPSYLAFRKNDMDRLVKMSTEKGLDIDDLRCDGCLSEHVATHCRNCRHGFRACAAAKKVRWCFECDAFPCRRLEDFKGVHVVNEVIHHEHVVDDLRDMKQHGLEQWVERQDQKSRCPGCGERLYWFDRECPECRHPIDRI